MVQDFANPAPRFAEPSWGGALCPPCSHFEVCRHTLFGKNPAVEGISGSRKPSVCGTPLKLAKVAEALDQFGHHKLAPSHLAPEAEAITKFAIRPKKEPAAVRGFLGRSRAPEPAQALSTSPGCCGVGALRQGGLRTTPGKLRNTVRFTERSAEPILCE